MTYREWDTGVEPAQSAEATKKTEPDGSVSIVVTTMHTARKGGTTTTRQKITRGAAWDLLDELEYTLMPDAESEYLTMEDFH